MVVYLILIFIHWIADFVIQTDWQAKNKSTNMCALLGHTATYLGIWSLALLAYDFFVPGALLKFFWFLPVTWLCHTVQDYFTSRLNKRLLDKGDIHNFFVSVGFDQVLHYVQLFLTYIWLA